MAPDLASRLLHSRRLVRAPIALYRAGLGPLLGPRLVLLEHRGRTSGLWRTVVLEVVDRPRPGVLLVAAGLGPGSQWFRNVAADPRVVVSSGAVRRRRARARVLPPASGVEIFSAYESAHPRAWAGLAPVLTRWAEPAAAPGQDWRELVPVVELSLVD
ncbi:nitroreductase family deazaflavin-dependent oxidoreductase [Cellulomonas sp. PhB143]|uniref:nitroreductase family deazaflavin-dependent oxidoreductase n=1 Tax=Cellulomonas sp. PhB143 TaxID=2485186 RepID=UPI000F4742DC|nr:nitroreductase family deazaflavin-dependent oxidoreductase [Cellulomonas sp. PhB143]ROS73393.1 deazaflavin-dependent oxidoreductase (nitroreductase family) [Cellulomonas sp. PhB143]